MLLCFSTLMHLGFLLVTFCLRSSLVSLSTRVLTLRSRLNLFSVLSSMFLFNSIPFILHLCTLYVLSSVVNSRVLSISSTLHSIRSLSLVSSLLLRCLIFLPSFLFSCSPSFLLFPFPFLIIVNSTLYRLLHFHCHHSTTNTTLQTLLLVSLHLFDFYNSPITVRNPSAYAWNNQPLYILPPSFNYPTTTNNYYTAVSPWPHFVKKKKKKSHTSPSHTTTINRQLCPHGLSTIPVQQFFLLPPHKRLTNNKRHMCVGRWE